MSKNGNENVKLALRFSFLIANPVAIRTGPVHRVVFAINIENKGLSRRESTPVSTVLQ